MAQSGPQRVLCFCSFGNTSSQPNSQKLDATAAGRTPASWCHSNNCFSTIYANDGQQLLEGHQESGCPSSNCHTQFMQSGQVNFFGASGETNMFLPWSLQLEGRNLFLVIHSYTIAKQPDTGSCLGANQLRGTEVHWLHGKHLCLWKQLLNRQPNRTLGHCNYPNRQPNSLRQPNSQCFWKQLLCPGVLERFRIPGHSN